MTNDQNEYLRNWVFRANEDIAVIENLFKSEPECPQGGAIGKWF